MKHKCISPPSLQYNNIMFEMWRSLVTWWSIYPHLMIHWGLMLHMFKWLTGLVLNWRTRLKVVHCIMILMLSYFLPLPWIKKALRLLLQPLWFMLWQKGENIWDYLVTSSGLGGVANIEFGNAKIIKLHYYEIHVNTINHGYIWCNILLIMNDWCMWKLRLKHHGGHWSMHVFL